MPVAKKPAARKPAAKKPAARKPAHKPAPKVLAVKERLTLLPRVDLTGYPILSGGSADPTVVVLTRVLAADGYDVPVGDAITPDVLAAVQHFRTKHHVKAEEGTPDPATHIGPNTWTAILARA